MTPDLQLLLAADLPSGIERRPLEELRQLRRRSQEWESAVSLARRLAQGRLDILGYELRRRAEPQEVEGGSELLFDLPDILADGSGGGVGRVVAVGPPGPAAEALTSVLDQIVDSSLLCRPEHVPDGQLPVLFEQLRAWEEELSAVRHALHERIDLLQGEIGRRYRDGEASVDTLLGRDRDRPAG